MDESLNQSITLSIKKPSKVIKDKKVKYTKITIFLLLIHFFSISIQKLLEYTDININISEEKTDEEKDIIDNKKKTKAIKEIFLIIEDMFITIFIILLLCKINNDIIILFSILFFLIGIIMLFYFFLYKYCLSRLEENLSIIIIYIVNNVLFFIEGFLLYFCSEIVEKEKLIKNREKYGYKNNEELLRTDKLMQSNIKN